VVQWLLDEGAAMDEREQEGCTALWIACYAGETRVVRMLVVKGADPTIASHRGWTPLIIASQKGHLEVVRLLLGHPSGKATVNHRSEQGRTALLMACFHGRGGVARALLASGADPTIPHDLEGYDPMDFAKQAPDDDRISAEGRRECVVALEVSLLVSALPFIAPSLSTCCLVKLAQMWGVMLGMVAGGRAGLPALEGPAGGRPAGERRGGGAEGAGGLGGEEDEGAGGLGGARPQGGPVPRSDGVQGVRGGGGMCVP
jgi:hypothetical protein